MDGLYSPRPNREITRWSNEPWLLTCARVEKPRSPNESALLFPNGARAECKCANELATDETDFHAWARNETGGSV
eukprot:8137662-Pyramimonas_sp.AAC.1